MVIAIALTGGLLLAALVISYVEDRGDGYTRPEAIKEVGKGLYAILLFFGLAVAGGLFVLLH